MCAVSFSLQRYVVSTDRSGDIHVTVQVSTQAPASKWNTNITRVNMFLVVH